MILNPDHIHRKPKLRHSRGDSQRLQALKLFKQGNSRRKISSILKVPLGTITIWVREKKEERY